MAVKCLTDNASDADETWINLIIESAHEILCAQVEENGKPLTELFGFLFCVGEDISVIVMEIEKRAGLIVALQNDVPDMFEEVTPWLCEVDAVEAMGMLRCVVGCVQEEQRFWARVRVQLHEGAQA